MRVYLGDSSSQGQASSSKPKQPKYVSRNRKRKQAVPGKSVPREHTRYTVFDPDSQEDGVISFDEGAAAPKRFKADDADRDDIDSDEEKYVKSDIEPDNSTGRRNDEPASSPPKASSCRSPSSVAITNGLPNASQLPPASTSSKSLRSAPKLRALDTSRPSSRKADDESPDSPFAVLKRANAFLQRSPMSKTRALSTTSGGVASVGSRSRFPVSPNSSIPKAVRSSLRGDSQRSAESSLPMSDVEMPPSPSQRPPLPPKSTALEDPRPKNLLAEMSSPSASPSRSRSRSCSPSHRLSSSSRPDSAHGVAHCRKRKRRREPERVHISRSSSPELNRKSNVSSSPSFSQRASVPSASSALVEPKPKELLSEMSSPSPSASRSRSRSPSPSNRLSSSSSRLSKNLNDVSHRKRKREHEPAVVNISRSSSPEFDHKSAVSRSPSPKQCRKRPKLADSPRSRGGRSRSRSPSPTLSPSPSRTMNSRALRFTQHNEFSDSKRPESNNSLSRGNVSRHPQSSRSSFSRSRTRSPPQASYREGGPPTRGGHPGGSSPVGLSTKASRRKSPQDDSAAIGRSRRSFSRSRTRSPPPKSPLRESALPTRVSHSREKSQESLLDRSCRHTKSPHDDAGARSRKHRPCSRSRTRSPPISSTRKVSPNLISKSPSQKVGPDFSSKHDEHPRPDSSLEDDEEPGPNPNLEHDEELRRSPNLEHDEEPQSDPSFAARRDPSSEHDEDPRRDPSFAHDEESRRDPNLEHDEELRRSPSFAALRRLPSVKTFPRLLDASGSLIDSSASMPILHRSHSSGSVGHGGSGSAAQASSATDAHRIESSSSPVRRMPTPVKSAEQKAARKCEGASMVEECRSMVDEPNLHNGSKGVIMAGEVDLTQSVASLGQGRRHDVNSEQKSAALEKHDGPRGTASTLQEPQGSAPRKNSPENSVDLSSSPHSNIPPELQRFIDSRLAICGRDADPGEDAGRRTALGEDAARRTAFGEDAEVRMMLKVCHNLRRFRRDRRAKYRRLSFAVLKRRKLSREGFFVLRLVGFKRSRGWNKPYGSSLDYFTSFALKRWSSDCNIIESARTSVPATSSAVAESPSIVRGIERQLH